MSTAKKRWDVTLEIACDDYEVEAGSEQEAIEKATRSIENSGDGVYVVHASAREIKYERPVGTDRWAKGADEIRFADGLHQFVKGDGCWWWTDGHAALRCEGSAPDGVRAVDNTIEEVVGDYRRARIEWKRHQDNKERMVAKTDKRVVVNADFVRLVESGCPGVEWYAVEGDHDAPWCVPLVARSGGEMVAVVMGIKET